MCPSVANLVQLAFTPSQAKEIAAQGGWCDVDEEWAYASASTITVPTGAASRFQVGDRIKLTQTTVKYFYIVGVADTLLTVNGGTDYTVANAAITNIAYSRFERPFGFPGFFNYAPTCVGFSAQPTDSGYIFHVSGRECVLSVSQLTNGTSNHVDFTIPLPITAASNANTVWIAPIFCIDNSLVNATPGLALINTGASSVRLYSNFAGAGFTPHDGKRAIFTISYEI